MQLKRASTSNDGAAKASWLPANPNAISRLNGYDADAITYYPVLIVGAGESGIAMGCRLKEVLGFDQFRIFDRQGGAGGTWWINRYPGVACDVPAIYYSFSFSPNYSWTSFLPPGSEIVKYLNDVCNKYRISDKIQCNTDVEGCRWVESEKMWEVYLRHMVPGTGDLSSKDRKRKIETEGEQSVFLGRETVRARMVISAVGALVEPRDWPENIPGTETFEGNIFHSARWKSDVSVKDKNVIVIGTGCSAAQLVPRLTKDLGAKSVTQLMRSAPWTFPRPEPPFGEERWAKYSPTLLSALPFLGPCLRAFIHFSSEYDFIKWFQKDDEWNRTNREKEEKKVLSGVFSTVPRKYHKMLTPTFSLGCKRKVVDSGWLSSLNDPRIELTTQPLKRVNTRSVSLGTAREETGVEVPSEAREVPADVIVLANGFDTTRWLHPLKIIGQGCKDLVQEMEARGGPQAYQGTAMDGFPNFLLLFGPNTATGHNSVILASENMVNFALQFVKLILNGDAVTFDVKRTAEEEYTTNIQRDLKPTVFTRGGCQSWYFDKSTGWNSTLLPYTQTWFGWRCMFPIWSHWNIEYTTKGIIKKVLRRGIPPMIALLFIISVYRARLSGRGLRQFKTELQARFSTVLAYVMRPKAYGTGFRLPGL